MHANAYQQYQQNQQQSINALSPMAIVVKLFTEAEKEILKAGIYIDNKNFALANKSIIKIQGIVHSLKTSLDMDYEISSNLLALYEYFFMQLVEANLKKDKEILMEILPMITELKETFTQISN
ncbi:MAG: flagellar export chaperone FliS [Clostridiales bacterium]|nr:flagellar export chaperone FliS [Clostridiales bacterium]